MAEDAGKKDEIRNFLRRVNSGVNFIEDIWIERDVKQKGSEGQFNEAKSLSGRQISNITELLTDDLRYTFDDSSFAFRFIAARPGSGKTAMLGYLRELIEVEPRYRNRAIVVQFPFTSLLSSFSDESFGVKFYSYTLIQTFWELMREDNTSLSTKIKKMAEEFLCKILGRGKVAQLKLATDLGISFISQLNNYVAEGKFNSKELFFDTIRYFLQNNSEVTFVYLIDELDALQSHQNYTQDAKAIFREFINEAYSIEKIRLVLYVVGLQDHVRTFINEDAALQSRISDSVVNLVTYRKEECEKIRAKIEERIEGAYRGCKDFDSAWQEIKNIELKPSHDFNNLREFCKQLSGKVIEIHEKYFQSFDQPFNKYESNARQLVEEQARQRWSEYLGDQLSEETGLESSISHRGHNSWKKYKGKNGYTLLVAKTTTVIRNHAVDCYAELWHNDHEIAIAYGEAKNYSLTKEHIGTFQKWLIDFNYDPTSVDGNPPDFAFIISPSCTTLQQKKLKLKSIEFIKAEKMIHPLPSITIDQKGEEEESDEESKATQNGIDLNNAEKSAVINGLKGTRIQEKTIDKLIQNRTYVDLKDLANKMRFSKIIKDKLQTKIESGKIYFGKRLPDTI